MDNCVVCLSTNADIFSRINFQSSEWQECSIQRIIEKHLWWWYMKQTPPQSLPWICRQCWQELSSFHTFYMKVEKVHKQYNLKKWPVFIGLTEERECIADTRILIKEEFKTIDSSLETLNEDLVPLVKFTRSEKNLQSLVISENIEINVKDEHLLSSTDGVQQNAKDELLMEEISNCGDSNSIDIWETFNNLDQNDVKNYKKSTNAKKEKSKKVPIKARKVQRECAKIPKNQTTESKNADSSAKLEITRKNDEYLAQSEYKLFCHLCNIPLNDFLNLKTHYRLEHKIPGYAMCCNKKFYNRGPLADHLRVHENPNYFKCTLCGRILAHRMSYENHLEFHKQSNETRERIFSCEKCDKSFFKKAVYDRHILSHVPDEERKFQCDECDKKFAAEYLVTQHKAFAHLNKYGKICDICGKSFRERFSFMRHMDEHSGAPPSKVPCDICGVELTSKYLLNRHKKKMHTKENQQEQICPYCSKVSPNMHAHRQHINYAHTMERKHACNMCEKKFKRPLELKEHLSTHTGEPLYTCSHCPRTFISSANMHKHRKAAHPKEWKEARLKKLTAQKLRELSIKEHLNASTKSIAIASNLQSSQDNSMLTQLKVLN
ncbi:transcription factor grauzone-like [Calliphora vicina]|uniref:transcription factor grauzone-like n=1 Tax=Calliphora vicina TaxID=7373 RepID=UPI00325A72F9